MIEVEVLIDGHGVHDLVKACMVARWIEARFELAGRCVMMVDWGCIILVFPPMFVQLKPSRKLSGSLIFRFSSLPSVLRCMMQKMASCVRRTEYRMHKRVLLQIPIKMMRQSRYHSDMMGEVYSWLMVCQACWCRRQRMSDAENGKFCPVRSSPQRPFGRTDVVSMSVKRLMQMRMTSEPSGWNMEPSRRSDCCPVKRWSKEWRMTKRTRRARSHKNPLFDCWYRQE